MADVITPEVLLEQARCYGFCIPNGLQAAAAIYLLNQSLDSPMTIPQILTNAACFNECIPPGAQASAQTYLLAVLQSQGGGGGGGGSTCLLRLAGAGPPATPPPCPLSIAASQPPNPGVWLGDSTTGIWEELVVPGP